MQRRPRMAGPDDRDRDGYRDDQTPNGSARLASSLPGSVTASAVILLVMGTLIALFGALIAFGASMFDTFADSDVFADDPTFPGVDTALMDSLGGAILAFAIILLLFAGAHFVAGIWIFKRRSWARITGLVLSLLALLILVIGIVSTVASFGGPLPPGPVPPGMTTEEAREMGTSSAVIGLVISGAFAAWALARRGDAFR